MLYILIMLFSYSGRLNGTDVIVSGAPVTVEFQDKEACEKARDWVRSKGNNSSECFARF